MASFNPGSYTSSHPSVGTPSSSTMHDAMQSYRRAQYYLADSVSVTPSQTDDECQDYENQSVIDEDADDVDVTAQSIPPSTRSYDPDAAIGNLQWDEDLVSRPRTAQTGAYPAFLPLPPRLSRQATEETMVSASLGDAQEDTPLLRKERSFGSMASRRPLNERAMPEGGRPTTLARRPSQTSIRSAAHRSIATRADKAAPAGQSTFGQTMFNAIATLLGIGMLSEPLAFAYAGWIGGMLLIISYGWIACYTAKILAHMILDDPNVRSYSDIARKAFGPRASPFISTLFCLELFTCCVAYVTLYADSLHSVMPAYSSDTYKIIGLLVVIPTTLMPLSLLSYASILGIIPTLYLVVVMFIDGFSKPEGLGSLWTPAETSLSFGSLEKLGMSFGLFMAGLSGHAVIPSLARDMIDPTQFDRMIDWSFAIATFIYTIIGVTGYMMFGNDVSDEFSQDLMSTPGFNMTMNKIALWGLIIAPLSKFALTARPINLALENVLGIGAASGSPDNHSTPPASKSDDSPHYNATAHQTRHSFKRIFTVMERVLLAILSVAVSILVPEFSSMMAFLGSFFAFSICAIGPISAKIAMAGRCGVWDVLLLLTAVVMAVWGTGAAFWSAGEGRTGLW